MAIIVNELEVVVTPPEESAPRAEATPPVRPEAPPPGPLELAAVLERRSRQALRVFAH